MGKGIIEIYQEQFAALVRQFMSDTGNAAYIGIKGLDHMEMRKHLYNGRIEPLGGHELSRCFVYLDGANTPELWVKPVIKGGPGSSFYETDWNNFSIKFYEFNYKNANTAGWNIDHLFPETTGQNLDLSHVRVMPIDADSNQALGRTIEKLMANSQMNNQKVIRKATYTTFAKAGGFRESIVLPKNRNDPVDQGTITRLIQHLRQKGLVENVQLAADLHVHLTRWSVTRIQGGDADQLGVFAP